MQRVLFSLLFAVALLPATIFLRQDGYFASSDGMIHLYRLFELDRSVHAGVLFPRWFPLSAYGYGLPVLNYYPPLTYYLGELFHLLGAGYLAAIKLTITTSFVLAALAMFLFARAFLGDGAAFVAAIAYAYSPYLLSDAYVRGNFPEMLTMSLLPFALWVFRSVMQSEAKPLSYGESRDAPRSAQKPRLRTTNQRVLSAAFAFAAIILTHHLTAMLFAALLVTYLALQFVVVDSQRSVVSRFKSFVACGIAIVLALALSAFYWVPALAELNQVYVSSASVARFLVNRLINPADFFVPSLTYTYLPQSDALKNAFGFPQTILALCAGLIAFLSSFRRTSANVSLRSTSYVLFFSLLVAFSIFMTLTPSASLWHAIPTLRFMQFPWRFQILATLGTAFLLGVWAKWIGDALSLSWRGAWSVTKQSPNTELGIASQEPVRSEVEGTLALALPYSAFAVALIALGIANLPVRVFALSDAEVDLTRSNDSAYVIAQMGWSWTREFVPATVQELEEIYAPVAKSNVLPPDPSRPSPSVQIQTDDLYSRALRVSTAQPFELSLKTFFFPGWQAYIDDKPAPTHPRGTLGLVSVTVPPGDHAVLFRFEDTPLRAAMNVVSLATLVGMLVGLFIARRRAFIVLIGATMVIAALFAWHTRAANAPPPTAITANLAARVQLIGYATERADETMGVTLYWVALHELDRDYNCYAHLIDAAGNVVAQHDGPPDQGLTPTTRWLPGEVVADRHALALRDVAPGEYWLAVGMYLPLANGFQSLGERVDLGRVQVVK